MKTAHYSRKHDRLQSIGNKETKLVFFLTYLSPVKQKKEILNTFLIMKTKFIILIYQNMILTAQMKVQTLSQKYLMVWQ